jgi:integrase
MAIIAVNAGQRKSRLRDMRDKPITNLQCRFEKRGEHNSLATYLISRGKDVKTIQELLRHAKVSTTLDLYSQAIDSAKLQAQDDMAVAITSTAAAD